MAKLSPELKAKALRLLSQGQRPGQVAKAIGTNALAVGAWARAMKKGRPKDPPSQASYPSSGVSENGGGAMIRIVEKPEENEGVPTGSGAGGAEAARAAGEGAPEAGATEGAETVQAEQVPLIDPEEALIQLSKLATRIFCMVSCNMNEMEWDPAYGEWTEAEEMDIRVSSSATALVLGPFLLKYALWIAPIMYTGSLFTIMSARVLKIKKGVPKKKTDIAVKEQERKREPELEEEAAARPHPKVASFWDDHPNG